MLTNWGPKVLRTCKDTDPELAIELGKELCENVFTAYQLLKYVTLAAKNGFELVINDDDAKNSFERSSGTPKMYSYLDLLSGLEKGCSNMTICKQIGSRLLFSNMKSCFLELWETMWKSARAIHPAVLITRMHGGGDKTMIISRPDLISLQSSATLRILKLREGAPQPPPQQQDTNKLLSVAQHILHEHTDHSLRKAIEAARDIGLHGEEHVLWMPWNFNISLLNDLVQDLILGKVGLKAALESWQEHIDPENQLTTTEALLILIACPNLFPVWLPSSILDRLDHHSGNLLQPQDAAADDLLGDQSLEPFLVLLPARDLLWDFKGRLKDLFRLKSEWSRIELMMWLKQTLMYDKSPSIDDLIADYLTPSFPPPPSGEGSSSLLLLSPSSSSPSSKRFINKKLFLERHDL